MNTLFSLAYEFFLTGLLSVGGGLATIPFLMDIAEKYTWFDLSMLSNMIAIGEATPGPVGINMATYAGYNAAGIIGGIVATFFLVLPSFIIILIIGRFLKKANENFYVQAAFYGIRPAVCGLIGAAGINLFLMAVTSSTALTAGSSFFDIISFKSLAVFAVFFTAILLTSSKKVHPIFFIIAGAIVGIVLEL